jgi:hypothetical protein
MTMRWPGSARLGRLRGVAWRSLGAVKVRLFQRSRRNAWFFLVQVFDEDLRVVGNPAESIDHGRTEKLPESFPALTYFHQAAVGFLVPVQPRLAECPVVGDSMAMPFTID